MMRGVVLTFLLIARTINSNKSNNIRVKQKGDGKGNYKFNLSLKVSKLVRVSNCSINRYWDLSVSDKPWDKSKLFRMKTRTQMRRPDRQVHWDVILSEDVYGMRKTSLSIFLRLLNLKMTCLVEISMRKSRIWNKCMLECQMGKYLMRWTKSFCTAMFK